MEPIKCAPGRENTHGSCLTQKELSQIGEQINKKYKMSINTTLPKKKLLREVLKAVNNLAGCKNDLCLISMDVAKETGNEDIINYSIRPVGPSKGTEWLSNFDIDGVLDQYEKVHEDFISFGGLPNDFRKLKWLEINDKNKFGLDTLYNNGKYKVGMVVNFDNYGMRGSHWTGLFYNLKSGEIYYFDSYGGGPKKEIKDYIDEVSRFMETKGVKPNYKFNKIRHQYKTSECGVYSMNFILRLLKGEKFENIANKPTKDDDVNKCRGVYFN